MSFGDRKMKLTPQQLRKIISEEVKHVMGESTVMVKDPETGKTVSFEVQPGSMPGTVKVFLFVGGGRATEVTLAAADAAHLAAALRSATGV